MSRMHPDESPAGVPQHACSGWSYVAAAWANTRKRRRWLALIVLRECVALTFREIGELLQMSAGHALRTYRAARLLLTQWAIGGEPREDSPLAPEPEPSGEFWRSLRNEHGPYAAAVFALVIECEFTLAQVGDVLGKDRGSMSRAWRRLIEETARRRQSRAAA